MSVLHLLTLTLWNVAGV